MATRGAHGAREGMGYKDGIWEWKPGGEKMGGGGGSGGGASLLLRKGSARKCTLPPVDGWTGGRCGQERPRQPPLEQHVPTSAAPVHPPSASVTGVGSGKERKEAGGGWRETECAPSLVPALASTGTCRATQGGPGEERCPVQHFGLAGSGNSRKKTIMGNGEAKPSMKSAQRLGKDNRQKPLGYANDF